MEQYIRHVPLLGENGQRRLSEGKVAVIGLGGLGTVAVQFLTRVGIGKLILVDYKRVDIPDLNRQIIYTREDIGKSKVKVVKKWIENVNPEIVVETIEDILSLENVKEIVCKCDVALDCLDNFRTRYILNDACVKHEVPFVHAAVNGFHGQVMTVIPGESPCLRCVFPDVRDETGEVPVIGSVCGVVGAIEALEAVKILTGVGELLAGKLLLIDLKTNSFEMIRVGRRRGCVCEG